jgi:hypothetical protein
MDFVGLVAGPEQDNDLCLIFPMSMSRDVLMLDLRYLIVRIQYSVLHIAGCSNIHLLVKPAMNIEYSRLRPGVFHQSSILFFLADIRLRVVLFSSNSISRPLNLYIGQGRRDYISTGAIAKINNCFHDNSEKCIVLWSWKCSPACL